MILIWTSQLLLTQHWLCSTGFDDLSSWQLFWDCFVQQFLMMNFWLFLNSLLLGVLHSLLLKFLFLLWKLLGVEFSPSWMGFSSSSAMLLIPCFWHQLPWECLSTAHSMTWFFCRNHMRKGMKSEGAPSFIWCTKYKFMWQTATAAKAGQPEVIFCV